MLAHRGLWNARQSPNSLPALVAALDAGFGVETDVRDCNGQLVISHDPPHASALKLEVFLAHYAHASHRELLALNIKADGLAPQLAELLDRYSVANYFCFDMSVPDHLQYLRVGLQTYARVSEYEPAAARLPGCQGVWLDGFESDWFLQDATLEELVVDGQQVCIVSPELHRRDYRLAWFQLQRLEGRFPDQIALCTDAPSTYGELKCA